MMHCTMEDLLALQAGEGTTWARRHLEAGAACRAEVEALYQRVARLKAFAARRPASDRLPAVRATAPAQRRPRPNRWGRGSLAAAAALSRSNGIRPLRTNPLGFG